MANNNKEIKPYEFYLLPKQLEFLFGIPEDKFINKKKNSIPLDVSCYQGGFGSGKTWCGSLRGILYCLKYPGIRGLAGAATQDQIDNTTKKQYVEHLINMGFEEGLHFWFEDRKTKLCFLNGSQVDFITLSDPDKYRSYNVGFVEFEEGSLIDERAFKILMSRLRQTVLPVWDDHFHYSLFIHTNPGGMRGWIYKNFVNPKTKKKGYRHLIAPTTENVFLHDNYAESMKEQYSDQENEEFIQGKDVDYDNTVAFPDFNEFNIRNNIKYNPNEPLILTCDFNYNPMCWYLVQHYNDIWFVLKELVVKSITTSDMCKVAQMAIDELGTKEFLIMGDSHGKDQKTNGSDYGIMLAYFVKKGYNVSTRIQKSNPQIRERLAVLRGLIKNSNGIRRLYVDSSCEILIYNFDACRNNLSNGGLKIPTDNEIQKDDNLRYLIHPIDAVSYPMWYINQFNAATQKGGT